MATEACEPKLFELAGTHPELEKIAKEIQLCFTQLAYAAEAKEVSPHAQILLTERLEKLNAAIVEFAKNFWEV